MSITFNAGEIFEMAKEIEQNGAKFYRRVAAKASSPETKKLLEDMANMEDTHYEIFERLSQDLTQEEISETVYDPDDEAIMYLKQMADSHGTEGKKSPEEEFTGDEPIHEILQCAIQGEKDSIVFYSALKNLVPPKSGKGRVEGIIKEEIGHLKQLEQALGGIQSY